MNLNRSAKTIIIVALKLGVTALAIMVILKKVGLDQLSAISIVHPAALATAFAFALLLVVLQAYRWQLLLQTNQLSVSFRTAITAVWFGHFLNNLLPTSAAGDVVRNFTLRYQSQQQGLWLGTLVAEKFVAMASALLLASLAALLEPLAGVPVEIKMIVWAVLLAMALGYGAVLLAERLLAPRLTARLQAYLTIVARSLSLLWRNRAGLQAFALSVIITVGMCLIFYLCAAAIGVALAPEYCAFVVPVFSVIASLPISYGGWGVRELSGVQLLGLIGIAPALSLGVCILYGLVILASSLPGIMAARTFMRQTRQNRQTYKLASTNL